MVICWKNIILALKAIFKGGTMAKRTTFRGDIWIVESKVDYIIVAHKLN